MNNRHEFERGAALVTVLIATLLLGTACIAMLSAVGASSQNNTDALSEAKAYYAAESGLQATINAVRNDTTVSYSYAANNPTLIAKLPYNWPIGSPDRVVVGEDPATYSANGGTAYSISISDPDNAQAQTTFYVVGGFSATAAAHGQISGDGRTLYIPNQIDENRTEITLAPNTTPTTVTFAGGPDNPLFSNFTITNHGTGATSLPASTKIGFELSYRITSPRVASTLVRGWFENGAAGTSPLNLRFLSQNYTVARSTMELCSVVARPGTSPGCTAVQPTLVPGTAYPVYAHLGPIPPWRLLVRSKGYGPNGALKTLEGIIQKDPFNGLGSGAATTMIGPPCTIEADPLDYCFEPGNSGAVGYSGGDAETGVPAFGFTAEANLTLANSYILNNMTPSQVQPPPAMLGDDIPLWQQSVQELDRLVDTLRTAAQNSNTYITNGNLPNTIGNPTAGTGITFCEGSCTAGGNTNGGGILVVTGRMKNNGTFNFRGLIIVTGEEGWDRSGAGGGQVIGNIVIAPYNRRTYVPENLSSTFLPPRYICSGCGSSDVVYSDVSAAFDSISGISDLMAGVAEK